MLCPRLYHSLFYPRGLYPKQTKPPSLPNCLGPPSGSSQDDASTHALLKRLAPFVAFSKDLKALPPGAARAYFSVVDADDADAGFHYQGPDHLHKPLAGIFAVVHSHYFGALASPPHVPPIHLLAHNNGSSDISHDTLINTRVRHASAESANTQPSPVASVTGTQAAGYLGSASAVGDFDGDGLQDYVFGAYSSGIKGRAPQQGLVQIRYGAAGADHHETVNGPGIRSRFGACNWPHASA